MMTRPEKVKRLVKVLQHVLLGEPFLSDITPDDLRKSIHISVEMRGETKVKTLAIKVNNLENEHYEAKTIYLEEQEGHNNKTIEYGKKDKKWIVVCQEEISTDSEKEI